MPVYQDNDSVDAYYFYRLLQRAKNINLIYNTESDENTAGISRFLLQVEYELAKQNPGINFSHKVAAADVVFMKKKEIRITKSEEIIDKLNEMQKLSASAIKSYINCSLQFYFKKIAGLKEENNLEEILDPADLGNLFHKVMEILYKPFENKSIGLEELVTIQKTLDKQYDSIFRESLNAVRKTNIDINLQGRNYLTKTIIKILAEKVIEKDKEYVPITIKGLEIQIENKINVNADTEIILTGKIDRMEQKGDIYRIIDYKTSDSQLKKPQKNQTKEDYFESFITNSKYNDTFQAFYYSYLFYKTNSDVKVNPALYIVKRASEGMQFLKDNYLTGEDIKTFEEKLLKLFKDLFNKEIDFTQTEDEDNCRYCEFRNLCYRE
jgi:CRISPR/Cas system-associated exonuclease Cas4 (RecB family)